MRDIAEPLDARGFLGGVGVQAFGDRVTDDRLTLFLQQLNQTTLLRHQGVDLRSFYIEEGGDGGLLVWWGNGNSYFRHDVVHQLWVDVMSNVKGR